jgi:putative tricarboxylic transport membrane protein
MGPDRLSSLVWLAFGLFCIYGAVLLDLGNFREPGTGFFPFVSGCFITLLALIVFVKSLLGRKTPQGRISEIWKGLSWSRPLAVGLIMLGYILFLDRIGFVLTSLVLLFLMLKWVERLPTWKSLVLSASASACTYLLFNVLLKATLPTGPFGF